MKRILLAAAAAAVVATMATSAHAWEQMKPHPPVFRPHGPFMVAVDPDGIIVNSQRAMILYPKEFSAMARALPKKTKKGGANSTSHGTSR